MSYDKEFLLANLRKKAQAFRAGGAIAHAERLEKRAAELEEELANRRGEEEPEDAGIGEGHQTR